MLLTEYVKELVWFSRVIKEIDIFPNLEIPKQFCDNQSAIFFSKNSPENIKTKHIDIKYQFLREMIKDNMFELKYVCSKSNLADFLTKPFTKEKLEFVIKYIYGLYKYKNETVKNERPMGPFVGSSISRSDTQSPIEYLQGKRQVAMATASSIMSKRSGQRLTIHV